MKNRIAVAYLLLLSMMPFFFVKAFHVHKERACIHDEMCIRDRYKKNKRVIRHIGCKKYGIQTLLKGIYINNDLLYLHTSLRNTSDISFDIDHIRFKVVDKKVARRTAMQENIIEPVRTYNRLTTVDGKATVRNIFVLPKLTLPDDKLLVVEIYEKGGARHQSFRIENTDLVAAKPISELHLK